MKMKQELLQSEEWYAIWHKTKYQLNRKANCMKVFLVLATKAKTDELLSFLKRESWNFVK